MLQEIKHRLVKPPILHKSNYEGRFHLYLDTSKFTTGSALYQIQNGKPKLITSGSKKTSWSSKELFNYRIRILWFSNQYSQFFTLIKRIDYNAIVDHLALTHIIKSKVEPATVRIKRLLELISS